MENTTKNIRSLTEAEMLEHITKARELASKSRHPSLPPGPEDEVLEELIKAVEGLIGKSNE